MLVYSQELSTAWELEAPSLNILEAFGLELRSPSAGYVYESPATWDPTLTAGTSNGDPREEVLGSPDYGAGIHGLRFQDGPKDHLSTMYFPLSLELQIAQGTTILTDSGPHRKYELPPATKPIFLAGSLESRCRANRNQNKTDGSGLQW